MGVQRIPLEVIQIPEPCPADWDAMTGGDRVRFCDGCKKHVHFLSAMTREEAERLVCESAGYLCVRMARLSDGTVLTVDYQSGVARRQRGWRFWTGVGLAGALLAGIAQAFGVGRPKPAMTMVAGATSGTLVPVSTPGTAIVAGTMPAFPATTSALAAGTRLPRSLPSTKPSADPTTVPVVPPPVAPAAVEPDGGAAGH